MLIEDLPLSRRSFLAAGAAEGIIGCVPKAIESAPPLKSIGESRGIRIGGEVNTIPVGGRLSAFKDPRYLDLLKRECAMITPGIELKWPVIEPHPGVFDVRRGDAIAAFAKSNGLILRGHNLVWMVGSRQPAWIQDMVSGSDGAVKAAALVRNRVEQTCARYDLPTWDVINEAIDEHTGEPRPSPLAQAMGFEATMDLAFHTARQSAPRAQLVYNDFPCWQENSALHRQGVLKLLEGFRKRGTPVDAVGIQSHLDGFSATNIHQGWAPQPQEWTLFLNEIAAMGYQILLTELDVDDRFLNTSYCDRDQAVADTAEHYLDLTLDHREVSTLIMWTLVDRYSWLQLSHTRFDLLARRPCPYDDNYQAKPLRSAIVRALRGAPQRALQAI